MNFNHLTKPTYKVTKEGIKHRLNPTKTVGDGLTERDGKLIFTWKEPKTHEQENHYKKSEDGNQ